MVVFSVAWKSSEAFELLCGQNQKTWADRKLKQVLTLSFTQFYCSLPPLTQTDTHSVFQLFFSLSLFLHSTKTLSVWQKRFHVNLSRLCVCVCICPSWASLEKRKTALRSSLLTQYQSTASSRSLFRDSCLRAHLHLSLMIQMIFRWHHAEFKMSFQQSQDIAFSIYVLLGHGKLKYF